jgi:hypothetical protein
MIKAHTMAVKKIHFRDDKSIHCLVVKNSHGVHEKANNKVKWPAPKCEINLAEKSIDNPAKIDAAREKPDNFKNFFMPKNKIPRCSIAVIFIPAGSGKKSAIQAGAYHKLDNGLDDSGYPLKIKFDHKGGQNNSLIDC